MANYTVAVTFLLVTTFVAATLQTLTGFAFALIMMPFATMALGVRTAAPLVALTALTTYAVNCLRYRA